MKRKFDERENEWIATKEATYVAQLRKTKSLKAIENERVQREIQAEKRKTVRECLKECILKKWESFWEKEG